MPTTLILGALIALAFALRFWRLGAWAFDSDETFTLRDSLHPSLSNPRPLFYFLNYFLVRPLLPLDEFGLRLLPAVFGVLAIPAFYLVGRRLVGTRAALFGALLLAVSPLHVYYSQFGRYWTLVFLLTTIYPYALYLGIRERNGRALTVGLVSAGLAFLAHPASSFLFGGLGVWLALTYLTGQHAARVWTWRKSWPAWLGVIVVVAVAWRLVYFLRGWISAHDTARVSTEFLLHLPGRPGVKQAAYLLSYVESLTVPLVLTGVLGIYLLWQARDRSLGLLLALLFVVPAGFLVLLSLRTPVSTFYLVPASPVFFLGAGALLDALAGLDWELRPRWLLPAAVSLMVVAAGTPTLLSQYRDGRRYDFRGVAHWLGPRLAPGDVVFSDQPKVLIHYLGRAVEPLRGDPRPMADSVRALSRSQTGRAVWVVSPAPAHAFRTNPTIGSLRGWIYENCQLRNTIGASRLDFRQYHLQVYRCAAAGSRLAGANSP